jgi:undecaprenyl-diphosphatase
MAVDETVFLWINNLAGRVWLIDEFFKGIANDYVIIVGLCLLMIAVWFGTREPERREANQKAVICAMPSLGIAQSLVVLSNHFYFRIRPFNALPDVNLLFYHPTDSSFPSNSAAIVFAISFAIFLANRKAGAVFLTLAILHAFARVYVGIHYPLDVLTSAAIGFVTALCFHYLIKAIEPWPSRFIEFIRNLYLA